MRDSDYMGMLPDGNLYVLLTNSRNTYGSCVGIMATGLLSSERNG